MAYISMENSLVCDNWNLSTKHFFAGHSLLVDDFSNEDTKEYDDNIGWYEVVNGHLYKSSCPKYEEKSTGRILRKLSEESEGLAYYAYLEKENIIFVEKFMWKCIIMGMINKS